MPDPREEQIIQPFQGTPAIRGTRITLYHVMDHYLARRTEAWTAKFYGLPESDINAAYAYIAEHEAEMMPEYQKMLDRERRGNPPHVQAMLARSHEKLMRRKAEFDRQHKGEAGDARAAG
jgi:uncharacterized protein (DUF433 family)